MIAAARLISKLAHKGQVDKAGDDYFSHPEAVAAMLDTPKEKINWSNTFSQSIATLTSVVSLIVLIDRLK